MVKKENELTKQNINKSNGSTEKGNGHKCPGNGEKSV